ncbi:MAG: hypothetical protein AAFW47_00985 [Pseudomonadota bacterium]
MRTIKQPGPTTSHNHVVCLSQYEHVTLSLSAGCALLAGLVNALGDKAACGAHVEVRNAAVSALDYVGPAPAPDETHAAWYSETRTPSMPGVIEDARLTYGFREGEPFFHCHGSWRGRDGVSVTGHLLPDTAILAEDTDVEVWLFSDARFDVTPCAVTNFSLFTPRALHPSVDGDAALVKLYPNCEIGEELAAVSAFLGWEGADVKGIGSIIGAVFDDGRVLESYATEFYFTDGRVSADAPADLHLTIVGIDGAAMSGRLKPSANATFITCEVILLRR